MTAPPLLAAPRRNRPGLLAQFVLQRLWLPLRDAYATERIRARIAAAERRPAAHRARDADGGAVLAVTVPARLFRGAGPDRASAVAAAEGWTTEVRGTGRDQWSPGALHLRRPLPQPGR
ncbi:hypothetical protein PV350_13715 [Streptomyces sp. PA03-6a]|nr:hypothetical protein [Streptomyces sp. PA03-6a]